MYSKSVLIASLAAYASAQSLIEVLGGQDDLSSLAGLVDQLQLTDTIASLSDYTVLAPVNSAIDAFTNDPANAAAVNDPEQLAAVITYHLLQGTFTAADIPESPGAVVETFLANNTSVNIDGAGQSLSAVTADGNVTIISGLNSTSTVTEADITFDGGVIHKIDTVLTLPANTSTTASAFDDLSTLVTSLQTAELVEAVDTTANLTIFAPLNSAFDAVSGIADLSVDVLTQVLQYHVVPGPILYSNLITEDTTLTTLQGESITVTVGDDGTITLNDASTVVAANIFIQNGVVHLIDTVLSPLPADQSPDGTAPVVGDDTTTSGDNTSTTTTSEPSSTTMTTTLTDSAGNPTATETTTMDASATPDAAHMARPTQFAAAGAALLVGAAYLI